ncbi:hypothetical protein C8Q76DRAFT_761473 [Earliella scabrosa]|nr:hypothetical protein C8Q76DRAFT_761473 [Earliella scabrosa]
MGIIEALVRFWQRLHHSQQLKLTALLDPGCAATADSEGFPSFTALRQRYTDLPGLPLHSSFIARIEYCRAIDYNQGGASEFVLAHIQHPNARNCIGYVVVRPSQDTADTPRDTGTTRDIAVAVNARSTIATTVGSRTYRTLLHAELPKRSCPLSYLIAAGQVLQKCYRTPRQETCYWFGASLFRLLADEPGRAVVHAGAASRVELLRLARAGHVDDCAPGLELRHDAEITNIRTMVEEARMRRLKALTQDREELLVNGAKAALASALAVEEAARMAFKLADEQRRLRRAAEAREKRLKKALDAVKRIAERRKREVVKHRESSQERIKRSS